jgi:hypothetical protein
MSLVERYTIPLCLLYSAAVKSKHETNRQSWTQLAIIRKLSINSKSGGSPIRRSNTFLLARQVESLAGKVRIVK